MPEPLKNWHSEELLDRALDVLQHALRGRLGRDWKNVSAQVCYWNGSFHKSKQDEHSSPISVLHP